MVIITETISKRELKRLITDVAKGKITKEEADEMINPKKESIEKPIKESEIKEIKHETQKRKTKLREVKK